MYVRHTNTIELAKNKLIRKVPKNTKNDLILFVLYTCLAVRKYWIINPTITPIVLETIGEKKFSENLLTITSITVTKILIRPYEIKLLCAIN